MVGNDADMIGRWLTPDPLGGDITSPQSLNRYAYALNNPETLADPLGLSCDNGTNGVIHCDVGAAAPGSGLDVWGYDYVCLMYIAGCPFYNGMPSYQPGSTSSGGSAPAPRPAPPRPNIITWPELQQLVHENNESNFCDELIDCIIFKESSVPGGFNANALGVPFHYGNTVQQAKGLMQVTQGAADTVNSNYPHATSGATLYGALSNPALNIFVGSEYLQILSDEYGGLRAALAHYGPKGYANDILNCVKQLLHGNFNAAEAAAHGRY
jgi:hypothetical protein